MELLATSSYISLRISDEGKGFDPDRTDRGAGLGLIGMTERLRLVGGKLSITSAVTRGTEIFAEVPLPASAGEGQTRTVAAGGKGS